MSDRYIPALGFAWLTSFYDPVVRWTTREATFKTLLVEQADIRAGHRVLDLGCGTGTLTMMLKRRQPAAAIVGIDGDPPTATAASIASSPASSSTTSPGTRNEPRSTSCFGCFDLAGSFTSPTGASRTARSCGRPL